MIIEEKKRKRKNRCSMSCAFGFHGTFNDNLLPEPKLIFIKCDFHLWIGWFIFPYSKFDWLLFTIICIWQIHFWILNCWDFYNFLKCYSNLRYFIVLLYWIWQLCGGQFHIIFYFARAILNHRVLTSKCVDQRC